MIGVFRKAIIGLNYHGSELYQLWEVIVDYPDKNEPILDEIEGNSTDFINMKESFSNIFEVKFLHWLYKNKDIATVRKWVEFKMLFNFSNAFLI